MTAAEIREKMDELEARVNPDCIGSYVSIFEVIAESDLRGLLDDLAACEAERDDLRRKLEEATELLEWTEDDDWWCEPGFKERRDAFLKGRKP